MAENQIILLPKESYGDWLNAALDYSLKFGAGFTNDPDSAGQYMPPGQVVTVVIFVDALVTYGVDIAGWFGQNYPGVKLDVVTVNSPDDLRKKLTARIASSQRFGQTQPAASATPGPTPAPASTPEPAPVPAPQPEPQPEPTPALAPAPVSKRGIVGELTLIDHKPTYAARIENIRICETIRNTTNALIRYGVLGIKVTKLSGEGQDMFLTSWSGDLAIGPGCTGPTDLCGGPWDLNIIIEWPGTYRLTLDICYSSKEDALSGRGEWETLTSGVTVTVVNWTPPG